MLDRFKKGFVAYFFAQDPQHQGASEFGIAVGCKIFCIAYFFRYNGMAVSRIPLAKNTSAFPGMVPQQVFFDAVFFCRIQAFKVLGKPFGQPGIFHILGHDDVAKPLTGQRVKLHAIPEV